MYINKITINSYSSIIAHHYNGFELKENTFQALLLTKSFGTYQSSLRTSYKEDQRPMQNMPIHSTILYCLATNLCMYVLMVYKQIFALFHHYHDSLPKLVRWVTPGHVVTTGQAQNLGL